MAQQKSRARYPERITFQMVEELKAQLLELAEREYGGGIQAPGRQCLQARVDGSGLEKDQLAEVLQALEVLRQGIAGRSPEPWVLLNDVLGVAAQMNKACNPHLVEMAKTRDRLEGLAGEVANQNRDLMGLMATPSRVEEPNGEGANRNRDRRTESRIRNPFRS